MIDHLSTYATNYPATKQFYQAVFEPLGYSLQSEFVAEWNADYPTQRLCAFGPPQRPVFWIIESKVEHSPRHVAFTASSEQQVIDFHRLGTENYGKNNGSPGLRPIYHDKYYGAFLLDPDYNNVEAVYHGR